MEFEVGEYYDNETFCYLVLEITDDGSKMRVLREDNQEQILTVDTQERIFSRIASSAKKIEVSYEIYLSSFGMEFELRNPKVGSRSGFNWSIEEVKSLIETCGPPDNSNGILSELWSMHGDEWERSPTAARYKYEEIFRGYYTSSRRDWRRGR